MGWLLSFRCLEPVERRRKLKDHREKGIPDSTISTRQFQTAPFQIHESSCSSFPPIAYVPPHDGGEGSGHRLPEAIPAVGGGRSGRLFAPVQLPGQVEQLLEVLVVQPAAAGEDVGQRPVDLEADPLPLVTVGPGVAGRAVAEQAPRGAVLRPQVGVAGPGTRLARIGIGRGVVGMELLALAAV